MTRQRITEAAERTLNAWLNGLMQGEVLIQDLPLAVSAWFHAGEACGRASRQTEIDDFEREVQRLGYLAFHTPGERRDMLLARLNHGLTTASPEQWDQLEADLHEMAGTQLNSDTSKHSARTSNALADGVTNEPGNPRTRKAA